MTVIFGSRNDLGIIWVDDFSQVVCQVRRDRSVWGESVAAIVDEILEAGREATFFVRVRGENMNSWSKRLWALVVACAALSILNPVSSAAAEISVEAKTTLTVDEAAALMAVNTLGEQLPAELALELAKFARDLEQTPDVQKAKAMREQLASDVTLAVASLGLNNLPALNGMALGVPFEPGTTLQTVFTTLGTANTVSWLAGSLIVPDLAPFLLPHNVRSIGTYTRTVTATQTLGTTFVPLLTTNIAVGQSFTIRTTLDADVLTLAGIDQALVNDTLVVQLPVATQLDITTTCKAITSALLGKRCTSVGVTSSLTTPDKVFATHPSWRIAYPVNAGEFATRATASDLLLLAYDLIGSVHSQIPASGAFASPFANAPGFEVLVPGTSLPELGAQVPPVTFYGLQTTSDAAAIVNTLIDGVLGPVLRTAGLDPVDLRKHAPVAPVTLLDPSLSLPRYQLGVTAGYKAAEVRSQQPNFMFVRWHNLGGTTVTDALGNVLGALSPDLVLPDSLVLPLNSAPATFYYDVPAGEYTLTNNRVDAQGGLYVVDYAVAADAPPVVIPPTAGDVPGLLNTLQMLLPAGG